MVELLLPKQITGVRFPSPAPKNQAPKSVNDLGAFSCSPAGGMSTRACSASVHRRRPSRPACRHRAWPSDPASPATRPHFRGRSKARQGRGFFTHGFHHADKQHGLAGQAAQRLGQVDTGRVGLPQQGRGQFTEIGEHVDVNIERPRPQCRSSTLTRWSMSRGLPTRRANQSSRSARSCKALWPGLTAMRARVRSSQLVPGFSTSTSQMFTI